MLLGRLTTAAQVGVYLIAFNVANWSASVMGSVLNSVAMPAFGRVSLDRQRLGKSLASATELVALVAFPMGALTVALSGPLIVTAFGSKVE